MATVNKNEKTLAEKVAALAEEAISEIRSYAGYVILSNGNPQYILSCLRMLGPKFCMETTPAVSWRRDNRDLAEGDFLIKFSSTYINEIIDGIKSAKDKAIEKEDKYYHFSALHQIRDDFDGARLKCEGVIHLLRLQAQDERNKLEENIRFEEDIKATCRKY